MSHRAEAQQQARAVVPQPHPGAAATDAQQRHAAHRDEGGHDGEQHREPPAPQGAPQMAVPHAVHPHVPRAENEKEQAGHDVRHGRIVPHIVARAVAGGVEHQPRDGRKRKRRHQRPINNKQSFHATYFSFIYLKKRPETRDRSTDECP